MEALAMARLPFEVVALLGKCGVLRPWLRMTSNNKRKYNGNDSDNDSDKE